MWMLEEKKKKRGYTWNEHMTKQVRRCIERGRKEKGTAHVCVSWSDVSCPAWPLPIPLPLFTTVVYTFFVLSCPFPFFFFSTGDRSHPFFLSIIRAQPTLFLCSTSPLYIIFFSSPDRFLFL